MNQNLENYRTTIIDERPLTLLPLVPGRRVHCILYGGDNGTITAVHGTPTPQNVWMLGGGAVVMGGAATVDVAFDRGTLSRGVPEAIVYGVQWRILDEVRSADQIREALEACEKHAAEVKAEEERAAQARAERRADTFRSYKHLQHVKPGEYPSAKLAAVNIRTELKAAFPGVKFSVRSDVYSGGDSVDVSWTLGPTSKEVDAIIKKYQEGSFNGMEDIYEDDRENVFCPMFGGAKYVNGSRNTEELWGEVCSQLCDLMKVEKPQDGKSWWRLSDDVTRTARTLIASYAFPVGVSDINVEHMPAMEENPLVDTCSTFARFYRLTWTTPEPVKREHQPVAAAVEGVTVTENPEKGGLEIRFPVKPAASVLEALKANGWRWSRFSSCWYTKASDHARAFAQSIAA